mmetsp:Transcript_27807/g.78637  ORF Transcript_27807/g.78637 Transcript_27807/m.78637 type:complete len:258 (+) Transcript_27807:1418-2191(+)
MARRLHVVVPVESDCGHVRVAAQTSYHHRVLALHCLRHLHLSAEDLELLGDVLGGPEAVILVEGDTADAWDGNERPQPVQELGVNVALHHELAFLEPRAGDLPHGRISLALCDVRSGAAAGGAALGSLPEVLLHRLSIEGADVVDVDGTGEAADGKAAGIEHQALEGVVALHLLPVGVELVGALAGLPSDQLSGLVDGNAWGAGDACESVTGQQAARCQVLQGVGVGESSARSDVGEGEDVQADPLNAAPQPGGAVC